MKAGETALLEGLSLSFDAPALVGILGPNGAGKSTLLRCLAGYRRPSRGEVLWNGRPLAAWQAGERGAICGYCPQQFEPAWDYSVAEIVALGRDRNLTDARTLDEILRSNGVDPLARRRWSQLSGGERARTMLAATLSTEPPLVLADEPGASLDMRHRLALLERLKAYAAAGRALVIVVMHDLDLALRFCDRLVLLDGGKVTADKPAQEMVTEPAFEAAFQLRLQTHPRRVDRDWVLGLG
ncbi:hypothetical protein ASE63_22000 [Bosea sp. Root381]|nr:hypothetical protein ASE63_22000 [Bosea sp. Root381]